MEVPPIDAPAVNEDEALDKELDAALVEAKAGALAEEQAGKAPAEVKPEEKKAEEVTPAAETPKVEEPSTPPAEEQAYEFRIPNKGKFESDESYEKRIELLDLVKKRKIAKTSDQRTELSEQIKTTKSQLKTLNGTDRLINPLNQEAVAEKKVEEEDETIKADKERLKQLGGATKEDIEMIVQKERLATEVKGTLDRFIDRHTELKDADTREVFFDFVDSNYNWQNKSGRDLMTVLELARENMFKPSESLQERVLKGANVQEKVNAMQFPGGTVTKNDYSPEMRKDLDELKATGMSEEKAVELLTD
jgi:hypothetical protein